MTFRNTNSRRKIPTERLKRAMRWPNIRLWSFGAYQTLFLFCISYPASPSVSQFNGKHIYCQSFLFISFCSFFVSVFYHFLGWAFLFQLHAIPDSMEYIHIHRRHNMCDRIPAAMSRVEMTGVISFYFLFNLCEMYLFALYFNHFAFSKCWHLSQCGCFNIWLIFIAGYQTAILKVPNYLMKRN